MSKYCVVISSSFYHARTNLFLARGGVICVCLIRLLRRDWCRTCCRVVVYISAEHLKSGSIHALHTYTNTTNITGDLLHPVTRTQLAHAVENLIAFVKTDYPIHPFDAMLLESRSTGRFQALTTGN